MTARRRLDRRSFLGRVAGGAVAMGGTLSLLGGKAHAYQLTDCDPTDPSGGGRTGRSGVTDSDPTDRSGCGRGTGQHTTPSSSGNQTYTGVTDADSGPGADRGGYGRGGGAVTQQQPTAVTDSDTGAYADPVGRGRGTQSNIDMQDDVRAERCANNRARLAELERQALEPEGWSDETLARARTELSVINAHTERFLDSQATGAELEALVNDTFAALAPIARAHDLLADSLHLDPWRDGVTARIARAERAVPQRAELHRLIAEHRNSLIALGCP
ncbi:MAG: twin-arginine translocation signal domain-containing protein [Sphingomonadaceae bacterium]|nr:twin-arginine translocation signal domain-containing protein [Sphingomonadaceae bacterium]